MEKNYAINNVPEMDNPPKKFNDWRDRISPEYEATVKALKEIKSTFAEAEAKLNALVHEEPEHYDRDLEIREKAERESERNGGQ